MTEKHFPAKFGSAAFNCPFCDVYATQSWWSGAGTTTYGVNSKTSRDFKDLAISACGKCGQHAYWLFATMIHPSGGGTAPPNADLNDTIIGDYHEAAAIVQHSPRGAAALLRLCVQKLVVQLGLPGKNLNDDIGELVRRGLDPDVGMALDTLRVVGNNAVHPLEMDLRDDQVTAVALFEVINFIADQMITRRKKLQTLFEKLPEGARSAIQKRDARD